MKTKAGVHGKGEFDLHDLIADVKNKASFDEAGAIAIFIGVVRGKTDDGGKVEKLELESYEKQADSILQRICEDLNERDGITDVQIHHLLGEFRVGEDLVYTLVAGAHRREVFSTLIEAVSRFKSKAPIFKKEYVLTDEGMKGSWKSEEELQ
ncbi:MAG: molybdenum cofactor biosynthesis protein MoaE [Candidatus Bathyarchaeota archaeon]|nr:MAG: molybdenum cofactor biosynthesis protein MoaE [Candidatus Bathyarchaeota archaeon]